LQTPGPLGSMGIPHSSQMRDAPVRILPIMPDFSARSRSIFPATGGRAAGKRQVRSLASFLRRCPRPWTRSALPSGTPQGCGPSPLASAQQTNPANWGGSLPSHPLCFPAAGTQQGESNGVIRTIEVSGQPPCLTVPPEGADHSIPSNPLRCKWHGLILSDCRPLRLGA
jgi:hypothetical protein